MLKKKSKDNKFYYVQCGDWDGCTIASSPREACANAIEQSIDVFGIDSKLTDVIICCDCSKSLEDNDSDVHAFFSESILEDMNEY